MDLVTLLLKDIHNFYPVGLPTLMDTYSGFKSYSKILDEKINCIIENKTTNWSLLKDQITKISQLELTDFGYNQFPSYIAKIKLPSNKNIDCYTTLELVINISLLCKFYTIYIDKTFWINDVNSKSSGNSKFTILCGLKGNESEKYHIKLSEIEASIKSIFVGYTFVSHKILFNTYIDGVVPYSESLDISKPQYSIYNLLFDSLFVEINTMVNN
jgi:hypothetical protein